MVRASRKEHRIKDQHPKRTLYQWTSSVSDTSAIAIITSTTSTSTWRAEMKKEQSVSRAHIHSHTNAHIRIAEWFAAGVIDNDNNDRGKEWHWHLWWPYHTIRMDTTCAHSTVTVFGVNWQRVSAHLSTYPTSHINKWTNTCTCSKGTLLRSVWRACDWYRRGRHSVLSNPEELSTGALLPESQYRIDI